MRVASRINQALARRRSPPPAPLVLRETAWYEELDISPTATQEELTIRYLQHAEEVEAKLSYLLESGGEDGQDFEDSEDDEDDDAFTNEEDDYSEGEGKEAMDQTLALQPTAATLAEATSAAEGEEEQSEAERVALEFTRLSNLYQILSVPQLRKIYDEGGVDGLAARVPQLRKGLLEPERVLLMARGLKEARKEKVSLLLRREPRTQNFQRYQATNSIKQVLRRLTDVFRVWCFKSPKSLAFRKGSVYSQLPEICIFGRVNSGKSALIRHLLSAGKLKKNKLASVSQWPGKTPGIDVFCVNRRFTIADTPGYSRGGTGHEGAEILRKEWKKQWKPLMEEYLKTTPWLRAAIYVHDIAKDVKKADMDTLELFKKHNIPVLLVFTKDDKVDSDTHRMSRAKYIRQGLNWDPDMPHAHYTTRRGGYGQLFKNMLGTMTLGLLATEERDDAWHSLKNELREIYFDYRDKWVPRARSRWGKIPKEKKVRTYPLEDKPYTDEELESEEREIEGKERAARREEKEAAGGRWGVQDEIEEAGGTILTPKERRRRWAELLQEARR